jgi:hypothetical protein
MGKKDSKEKQASTESAISQVETQSDNIQLYQQEQDEYDEQLPPYTSPNIRNASSNSNPTTKFPPQPYHAQSPSLSFIIAPKSWISTSLIVADARDKNAILYTAKPNFMSSDMTIRKISSLPSTYGDGGDDGAILASAEFHIFRRRTDVSIHGHTITLPLMTRFIVKSTFALPALQNARVTWRNENHLSSSDLLCMDERDMCLARISTSRWALKRESQFDLFGSHVAGNSDAVDEIVATGLTLLHHINRRRRAAAAGAAGGAGA